MLSLSSSSCVSTPHSRLVTTVAVLVIVAYYCCSLRAICVPFIPPSSNFLRRRQKSTPKITSKLMVAVGAVSATLLSRSVYRSELYILGRHKDHICPWRYFCEAISLASMICSHVFRCFSSSRFINQSFPNGDMNPFHSMPN